MVESNLLLHKNVLSNVRNRSKPLLVIGSIAACILLIYVYSNGIRQQCNRISIKKSIEKSIRESIIKSIMKSIIKPNSPNLTKEQKLRTAKDCYRIKNHDDNIELLDDIENPPPPPDNSIFFVDTTCRKSNILELNARKACAIESAARLNPNRNVYVVFVTPVGFDRNGSESPMTDVLEAYPNVHLRNVDIYKLSKGTPAEQWIKEDRIFESNDFPSHLSDYLRFTLLYKFGGIYLDLDHIIIKNFDGLPPNFATQQEDGDNYINSSALGIKLNYVGRKIIELLLRECFEKYQPHSWDYNGPWAVWRATQTICNSTKIEEMLQPQFCWGFTILPHTVFFPLAPFFEAFDTNPDKVENSIKKFTNETRAVHLWSSNTRNRRILKTDRPNVYTILAKKVCPNAYENSGTHFDKK